MVKIFVGGLSPEVSEIDLVTFISLYAQVVTIKMVRDKVTKKPKGYAFLEMSNQEEAEKAVARVNERTFKGNVLTVKISEEPPAKPIVRPKNNNNNASGRPKRPRI